MKKRILSILLALALLCAFLPAAAIRADAAVGGTDGGSLTWTNWSGKTAASLVVTAGSNNNGCQYRCVVKNSCGSVTSNAATLTVTNS